MLLGVSPSSNAATVLDGGVTLPDGQAALCGGDVPLTGCVFFIDPVLGSPSNDGMSIASPWDCETLNAATLPAGARVVVMDDTVDSDCIVEVDWSVDATNQNIVTTAYLDSTDNTVRYYDSGTGASRGEKAEISFVDYRSVADKSHIDVRDIKLVKKWRPGHYIYTHGLGGQGKSGKGMIQFDESHQQRRWQWWDNYRADPAFAGVTFITYWGQVEPVDDDWSALDEIEEDLDYVEAMPVEKGYLFWFHQQKHGGGGDTACPVASTDTYQGEDVTRPTNFFYFPEFLWDNYWGDGQYICDRTYNPAYGLVLENPDVMRELLEFWAEFARRFDQHPALEAVIVNLETATGGAGGGLRPGFTQTIYREAFKEYVLAVKSYFQHTSVIFNVSYKMSDGQLQSDYDDLLQWMVDNGIGVGNTDLPPKCVNQPWGSGPQDPDCPDGIYDVADEPHGIRIHNSQAIIDFREKIPSVYRVAGDQLGKGHWVGQQGGYSPEIFVEWCNSLVQCTHLFWIQVFDYDIRHGEPDQAWSQVVPWIRTSPEAQLFNTACPESACK